MRRLFTILCAIVISSSISAQQADKGTLLLEGDLSGTAWTGLSTEDLSFGIYLADGFALTIGYKIGVIEDDQIDIRLGARIHFTESQLIKIDLEYDDSEVIEAYVGFANRFYYKDWMSIEPQVGLQLSSGDETDMHVFTGVGFNLHFQR